MMSGTVPFAIALLAAAALPGLLRAAEPVPIERALGTWRGFSVCTGTRAHCSDDRVRYHITRAAEAGQPPLLLTAEALAGGSWDTTFVIPMHYDAARGQLSEEPREIVTGVPVEWRFRIAGDRLEGALVDLTDSALIRVSEAARDTAIVTMPENPETVFAPIAFLVGGEWRSPQERFFSRTYEWGDGRVAVHFRQNLASGFFAYDPVNRVLVEWRWLTPYVCTRREFTQADAVGFTIAGDSSRTIVRHTGPDSFTEINHSRDTLSKAGTAMTYSRVRP
jgi:hypothetical protein